MKKPAPAPKSSQKIEGPFTQTDLLPTRVAAMRERILEACATGDIDNLRPAIERNETLPLFGRAGARAKNFATAVEFLRDASFDRKGRETLALLEAVLTAPFLRILRGPHVSYTWPSFALAPPPEPDEATRLHMARCIAFSDFAASQDRMAPLHRLDIGEDGTWHAFGVS